MQKDLNVIYKWVEENFMKFSKEKKLRKSNGMINNITVTSYKCPTGKRLKVKGNIKICQFT